MSLNNTAVFTKGVYTKRKASKNIMADISYGTYISNALKRMDCGQSVVIKNKTIMAVESSEGRLENIIRGCSLSNGHACIVIMNKLSESDNSKVVINIDLLKTLKEQKVSALAVEEGVYAEKMEDIIKYADNNKIILLAFNKNDISTPA